MLASCANNRKNSQEQNNIDAIILSSSMQGIFNDYIKTYPAFGNLVLDNEACKMIPKLSKMKFATQYYLLGPAYVGERFDEVSGDLTCPAICLKFCGKNIFVKSSVDKITDQVAMHHKYVEHQEFHGIKRDIDKYYWLIRIEGPNKAYVITKYIQEYGIQTSDEIQVFKAPINKNMNN